MRSGSSRLSLRTILTVPFVALVVISVGITSYLAFRNDRAAVNAISNQLLGEVTERVVQRMDRLLSTPHLINRLNAELLHQGILDLEQADELMRHFYQQSVQFQQDGITLGTVAIGTAEGGFIGANASEGYVVLAGPSTGGAIIRWQTDSRGNRTDTILRQVEEYDATQRPWFMRGVAEQRPAWSINLSVTDPTRVDSDAVLPYFDATGEFRGVLTTSISLAQLHNFLREIHIGDNGHILVIERSGLLVAASIDDVQEGYVNLSEQEFRRLPAAESTHPLVREVALYLQNTAAGHQVLEGGDPFTLKVSGEHYRIKATPYRDGKGFDLVIVVAVPERDLLGQIQAGTRITLLAIGATLALMLLFTVLTARSIVTPILELNEAAGRLAAGQWQAPVDIHRGDELGELADSFNSMAAQFTQLVATLEERVAQRTRDLRIASEVARQTNALLDLEELLPRLVEETSQGFDLYHVSIYLYQPENNQLVLAAASGEVGKILKAVGETYDLDDWPSLITRAARERQKVVVNDVHASPDFLPDPRLPETRSEVTLPMMVGGELIGVLNIEAAQKDRFKESDVEIFATVGEQIGIAVRNAQLYGVQVHAAEQLRAADRIKSQFLASVSHELRTPLNAILIYTEMLSTGLPGPVNQQQSEMLANSLESGRHLQRVIDDVLDMSKIQAGMLTLALEKDVNLYQELEAAADTAETLLKGKPVQLVKEFSRDLPALTADRRRIRQILLNLLANAAKFTERGAVTLGVNKVGNEVLFRVSDTGPGIAKEQQEQIFKPFVQTETGVRYGGTGLGLPISRSLAEAHGGRLWVESEPGQGATFYVALPVSRANNRSSPWGPA